MLPFSQLVFVYQIPDIIDASDTNSDLETFYLLFIS